MLLKYRIIIKIYCIIIYYIKYIYLLENKYKKYSLIYKNTYQYYNIYYNKKYLTLVIYCLFLFIFLRDIHAMNRENEEFNLYHRTLGNTEQHSEEETPCTVVDIKGVSISADVYEDYIKKHSLVVIDEANKSINDYCPCCKTCCKNKQTYAVAAAQGGCCGAISIAVGYGVGKLIELCTPTVAPTEMIFTVPTPLATAMTSGHTLTTVASSIEGITQTTAITMGCCGLTCCLLGSIFGYLTNKVEEKNERIHTAQQRLEYMVLNRQFLSDEDEGYELVDFSHRQQVVTNQPQRINSPVNNNSEQGEGSSRRSSEGTVYEEIFFLPGYNRGGQISSLLSMQYILAGPSAQVSSTLKMLALKAHRIPSDAAASLQLGEKSQKLQGPNRVLKADLQFQNNPQGISICRMFAFTDKYECNLEKKIRSGRAGLVAELFPGMTAGLAYTRHNEGRKSFEGIQLGTGSGSVTSKTESEALSAVIALNSEGGGVTGHIASYHGWGKMKTSRSFIHAGSKISAKGKPNIYLNGGLIQVGYNISLSKTTILTPYIEGMMSMVNWDAYTERSGLLPCKISRSEEYVAERSVGLRHHWKPTSGFQIQSWIACISGERRTDGVSCRPLVMPIKKYESYISVQERKYVHIEFGASYSMSVTDTLQLGIDGMIHLDKVHKIKGKSMSLSLMYLH
ncbi:hypothetical protein BW722_06770 [Lawsonia intracellularis]|nr:hypothetical protein BW722_06770 [Lawsonia intracellularis]